MGDYTVLTKLDRLIHNPGRLAILAVLLGCESADFTFLEQATDLNKGAPLQALDRTGTGRPLRRCGIGRGDPKARACQPRPRLDPPIRRLL